MSSKTLQIALILTAYDKATRVINDAVDKSGRKLKQLQKDGQASMAKGAVQIAAGMAIAAPIIKATEAAIAFEDKMADVAKVMSLTVGSKGFNEMGDQAKDLAVYLGKSGTEAAGLMANLAAGGVEKANMKEVGKIAGEMGVAFGMASDVAGSSFIKIKNALNVTIPEAKKVADAINFLSDSMASEAGEIVTFMASGGSSVAASFKVAGKDAAAFGSTLISLGKSSSESATIFERFAKGIFKNASMKKIFDEAGGGAQGMMAVLEKGKNSKDQFAFFSKFGQYGSDIQLLASRSDLLGGALKGVADETKYANSVQREFANRNSTTAGKLAKMRAQLDVMKITLGEAFLPLVQKVANFLGKIAKAITDWAKENPRLAKSLMYAAAAAAGFLMLAGAFRIVKGAFMLMKVAMMTNPVGLILMAIALVVGVIIANWDKIGPWFTKLWANIKRIFTATWNWIKNMFLNYTPHGLIIKHWDKITGYFKGLWTKVKNIFLGVWEWIKGLHVKMFEAGKNIVKGIGDGISNYAHKLIDKVKKIAKAIRDFFPFSPAKEGPLKDIHKMKLVETIAMSIKPGPAVDAVNKVASGMAGAGSMGKVGGSGSGGVNITYAPNITMGGGTSPAAKLEFSNMLKQHAGELMRLIKSENDKKVRVSF